MPIGSSVTQFPSQKGEMDMYIDTSDAVWQMGTKEVPSVTDFSEHGGPKGLPLLWSACYFCSVCVFQFTGGKNVAFPPQI